MEKINKVAAIILKDKKLLVLKKKSGNVLISPGGKSELNENPEMTLRRELKEELDVDLVSIKPFGKVFEKAIYEDADFVGDFYFAKVKGDLKPKAEIEKYFWIGKDHKNMQIGSALEKHVIPKLIEMGLLE